MWPCLSQPKIYISDFTNEHEAKRLYLTAKSIRQFLLIHPCPLRCYVLPGIRFGFRLGLADRFLCSKLLSICAGIETLFQFPQRGLVCLLRSAGAVVIEIDRQLLKGHANLVRPADPVVASHQIQLFGRQHLIHPLHQQHPTHEAVIGNGGIAAAGKPRRPVAALGSMKSRLLKSLS